MMSRNTIQFLASKLLSKGWVVKKSTKGYSEYWLNNQRMTASIFENAIHNLIGGCSRNKLRLARELTTHRIDEMFNEQLEKRMAVVREHLLAKSSV